MLGQLNNKETYMDDKTFPCIACGAPVEPYPGAIRAVCSYCGSAVTIPKELRRPAAKPKLKEMPGSWKQAQSSGRSGTEADEVARVMRKVQPAAIKAYNTFALWTFFRRIIPGCLVVIAILCALSCLVTFGGMFLLNQPH
jgi:DNA-directed RNA polymerase subunit RPC12/RpoP